MLSNLSYQLKLGCYKIFYVSFTVTTKEKPVVDMQKVMIKESKHTTTKSHQVTEFKGKRGLSASKTSLNPLCDGYLILFNI